jgi:hypothetical protein
MALPIVSWSNDYLTSGWRSAEAPLGSSKAKDIVERRPTQPEERVVRWLEQGRGQYGTPQLAVERYSEQGGLLATYQATNGKRLAFKANWRSDGSIRAEVAHFSTEANRVMPLMARSRMDNRQKSILRLADFDVLAELNRGVFGRKSPTGLDDATSRFIASEDGVAYSEGVLALYIYLDELDDTSGKLSDLYAMYGALLMGMQLSSDIKIGFEGAVGSVGLTRSVVSRERCNGRDCKAAGRKFLVHLDGQFDVLTKLSATRVSAKSGGDSQRLAGGNTSSYADLQGFRRKNGDGTCENPFQDNPCFGKCGPGCFNPGDITTMECAGHDLCVCKWGHWACAISVPTEGGGCVGCHTLVEAIGSFISAFFSMFGSEPPEDPFEDPYGTNFMGW